MASENAKAVAQKVISEVGKGRKVSLRKIIREKGYSASVADSPKKVTETEAYKETITPFIEKMTKERDRIITALESKNLSKEKYRDMIDGLDKLTKNIQLLNGGETERAKLQVTFDNAFIPAPKKDSQ